MKRFSFPLERVRRFRSEQASVEELKLGQLRDRLSALGEAKQRVELARARSEREVLGQPSIASYEVQNLEAYRRHAASKIRALEAQQRQCETQVREQRQRLIEARQRAELLERLKQKALEEWTTANNREEEALATELYLAKRARRVKATPLLLRGS
jgi:flagellar export protein FliJ